MARLDVGVVWHWAQRLNVLHLHGSRTPRHNRLSLQLHTLTLLLGLSPLLGVLLDSVQELLSRSRSCDVLDSDVDSLLEVSVADLLVDDDTDGGFRDVVDDTGLAVVDLVWHTLLYGTVDFNVDYVTDPVGKGKLMLDLVS